MFYVRTSSDLAEAAATHAAGPAAAVVEAQRSAGDSTQHGSELRMQRTEGNAAQQEFRFPIPLPKRRLPQPPLDTRSDLVAQAI